MERRRKKIHTLTMKNGIEMVKLAQSKEKEKCNEINDCLGL